MKKIDKDRFDKLRQIGCIACLKKGRITEPVIHHTIPLCPQHHNMGNASVHLNKKLFEHLYGTEQELLKETNLKIIQLEMETTLWK